MIILQEGKERQVPRTAHGPACTLDEGRAGATRGVEDWVLRDAYMARTRSVIFISSGLPCHDVLDGATGLVTR